MKKSITFEQLKTLVKEGTSEDGLTTWKTFKEVDMGDIATDFYQRVWVVVGKTKASDVADWKEDIERGIIDPDDPVVLCQSFEDGEVAEFVYDETGAIVKTDSGNIKNITKVSLSEGCGKEPVVEAADVHGHKLEEGDQVIAINPVTGSKQLFVVDIVDGDEVDLSNDDLASLTVKATECEWVDDEEAAKWREDHDEEMDKAMDKANPDTYDGEFDVVDDD